MNVTLKNIKEILIVATAWSAYTRTPISSRSQSQRSKVFHLRIGQQAGTSGSNNFLRVILPCVKRRRLSSHFRTSYTITRMDRRFFTIYPFISSLENVSVLVSAHEIYQVACPDSHTSRSDGKWQGKPPCHYTFSRSAKLNIPQSSLTLSLLRAIFTEGNVYYDGKLTSSINLNDLRSSITIIPQMVLPGLPYLPIQIPLTCF